MPALVLPEVVYLRHTDGESIGPLPLRALEVLFDTRIVDEATPISETGVTFRALRDFPALLARVQEVKQLLVAGQDPWPGPMPQVSAPNEDAPDEEAPPIVPIEAERPLRAILRAAVEKSTGILELLAPDGSLELTFKDGKIVAVETSIPALALSKYLVANGVATDAQIQRARERAPAMGGDVGGAMIALGLVEPHTYFEKLVAWARFTLASIASRDYDKASLLHKDVPNPPVPLGLDRFGVLSDIVRDGAERSTLQDRYAAKRPCPLIPSQLEGAKIEDLRLKAAELRVINMVNGARTLGEILETLGGNETKSLEVMRVVFLAEETGFVVFGNDPLLSKEIQEAAKVREQYERMRVRNYFEILQVNEKSSDDETRTRYADLAKQFHPDKLRQGAAPELIDARREVFGLVNEAFEALTSEEQRYKYANDLSAGRVGSAEELAKVQSALQAETLFKKAEILAKMRKLDDALQHLDQALRLKPDDTEFKIYRAYYGYLHGARGTTGTDAAEKAIKAILALLKVDANIAAGYMFLGNLYKIVNKPQVAARYFEKVLEYDERNPDAIREVRLFRMREDKDKKKKWF